MLATVTLASLLLVPAAPAPAATAKAPVKVANGLPPRLLELKPDDDGKVRVTVFRPGAIGVNPAPNLPQRGGRIAPQRIEIGDLTDLTVTTVGGKAVSKEEAVKSLASGGIVILPADGKAVPDAYRKLFKEDVLILTSPDLTGVGVGGFGGGGINVQILPAGGLPGGVPAPNAPQRPIN